MKLTKAFIVTLMVAGGLLKSGPVLPAQEVTNAPPPAPPSGAPPPGPIGGPGMGGQPNFDVVSRQLKLTDNQKPRFKAILETRMRKLRDLRRDPGFASMSPAERGAKVRAIQDEMETQMKALLTPGQFEKWMEMPRMGMRGRRLPPPPVVPDTRSTNAPAPPAAKPPQ